MSRKSRKDLQLGIKKDIEIINYNVAIYTRLSVENFNTEDNSIKNQIFLAKKYINSNDDLKLIKTYSDNGYSGISFDRPEFKNMMDDIKNGKINTILVKDLSRFGRNYLEVGNYLENIFPYLDIRFISINDDFDTLHLKSNDKIIIYLKSIMHENYARDISKKICTSLDSLKKSGKFLGKAPPFGYVRSKDDKHKLEIHKERSIIVKQIFNRFILGDGASTIARSLNNLEVPCHLKIRFIEGYSDGNENSLWSGTSIMNILSNYTYLGMIVFKKSEKALYKNKSTQSIDKSEWEFIENTHEPIIDEETFFLVQNLRNASKEKRTTSLEKNNYKKRNENIFANNSLICGCCGYSLKRNYGYCDEDGNLSNYHFKCHRKYVKSNNCDFKSIKESIIIDVLSEIVKTQIKLLFNIKQIFDTNSFNKNICNIYDNDNAIKKELNLKLQQKKLLKENVRQLYEDFKNNLFDEDYYKLQKNLCNVKIVECEDAILSLENKFNEVENNINLANPLWIDKYLAFENFELLTSEIYELFFEKVVITNISINGNVNTYIKTYFKYSDEYEKVITLIPD